VLQSLYTIAAMPQPVDDPATPPAVSRTDFDAVVQDAFGKLNDGLSGIDALVSRNGRNQALIESTKEAHQATQTILKSQIGNIENVDLTDASTRLTQLQTQLQAAFQTVALLRSLNLVDYLR
jgi:flagellar hook-associated protein 3 FlgL